MTGKSWITTLEKYVVKSELIKDQKVIKRCQLFPKIASHYKRQLFRGLTVSKKANLIKAAIIPQRAMSYLGWL